MKVFVVCILVGLLMGNSGYLCAQTNTTTIQGEVSIGKNTAAKLASVILLTADSAILKSTVCDNDGMYKFTGIGPGKYLVLASKIGYKQSVNGPYILNIGGTITVNIGLIVSLPQLKEVTIASERPYVEVKPGKVVLNVQRSSIAEGNSAYDILRQAPGVKIGNSDNISLIGHQSAMIMLDGKPTNVTGEALTGLLQGMPSSNIQQIELITNPSAKYEAAGAGIINIISKKGTNVGTNGTLTLGLGYGKFYKSNAGLTFNHRTDKFNVFGSYAIAADKVYHEFTSDRVINSGGAISNYDVDYYTTQQKYNSTFKAGADYYIAPNQTLGILVYGSVSNNAYVKSNNLIISNSGHRDSTITTNSNLNRDIDNINYDINYIGVLDKAGKMLTIDVLYNDITRNSGEFITDNFFNAVGGNYRPSLLLQNLSPSATHNWVAKVDYVSPLSKTAKLEMGLKYSWVKSTNNQVFGPLVNGVYQNDPMFTNTFVFHENINSAYVNYTNNMNKLNMIIGLRAEQTNNNGNSVTLMEVNKLNYLDLLPQVQLTYKYNEKNEFSLSYNRGIQRPSYADINPFLYYVDVYDYRSGNPALQPQYSNKIELEHSYNHLFTTTLYAHITTDFYGFNEYIQNDATRVEITKFNNFGNYYTYGLKFYAPVQFNHWWDASFNLNGSYQRIKAYAVNGNLNKGTQDVTLSTTQTFKITNTITADVYANYETPTFFGISQYKSVYNVDADISTQLFNKKASLKLGVVDIFNTISDRLYSNYQNLNLTIVDKLETRVIKASFIYRFGKSSVKTVKHDAANADEQSRAGTNGN